MLIAVGRALRRRCPRCGSGSIFAGYTRLRDRCPACGLRFERQEGYWVGAMAVNTAVTIAVYAVTFVSAIVLTWPDPPWVPIAVGTVALNAVFPIVFYPWSKTLWMALDLTVHPAEDDEISLPTPPGER